MAKFSKNLRLLNCLYSNLKLISALCILLMFLGCSTPYRTTLPSDLSKDLESSLTFPQIKESPNTYSGKIVLLGGQILEATRRQDSTELTILQLPLVDDGEPRTELTHSQGRYLAYQEDFLDPATVPPGTRVTLVGQLSGSTTQNLDETEYTYPTLIIKHLKVWPTYASNQIRYGPRYPYWTPYPYGYPYWGPRGRFFGYYPAWYW